MAKERIPAKAKPSGARRLKNAHRSSLQDTMSSLREFARLVMTDDDHPRHADLAETAERWFFNKRANFSKPVKCIGSTRKKKNKNNQQRSRY